MPINRNDFGLGVLQGTSLSSMGGKDSRQVYLYKAASSYKWEQTKLLYPLNFAGTWSLNLDLDFFNILPYMDTKSLSCTWGYRGDTCKMGCLELRNWSLNTEGGSKRTQWRWGESRMVPSPCWSHSEGRRPGGSPGAHQVYASLANAVFSWKGNRDHSSELGTSEVYWALCQLCITNSIPKTANMRHKYITVTEPGAIPHKAANMSEISYAHIIWKTHSWAHCRKLSKFSSSYLTFAFGFSSELYIFNMFSESYLHKSH